VRGTSRSKPGNPLALYADRIMLHARDRRGRVPGPFHNAFVQGNPGLGVGILCGVVILGVDAVAIYLKKSPPIPMILLLVPMTVATGISLKCPGLFRRAVCNPAVLLFTSPQTPAWRTSAACCCSSASARWVYHYIGLAYTIRFSMTLTPQHHPRKYSAEHHHRPAPQARGAGEFVDPLNRGLQPAPHGALPWRSDRAAAGGNMAPRRCCWWTSTTSAHQRTSSAPKETAS